jgi:hypothetical protein
MKHPFMKKVQRGPAAPQYIWSLKMTLAILISDQMRPLEIFYDHLLDMITPGKEN